jgi:AraC family transcriptional regulator
MDAPTLSRALTGVVPAVCDAEAGETDDIVFDRTDLRVVSPATGSGLSVRKIRSVMAELCSAIRSALDDERCTAEASLHRAAELLREMGEATAAMPEQLGGRLAPWQIRKVSNYVDAHLSRSMSNEDLAALVRLTPSHFGRAFRNSFGEPPHEYVIRRRIERAQGLMLSTAAPLSEIALDCGLADQSHLTRLFRRIAGQTPRAWRRARIGGPAEEI